MTFGEALDTGDFSEVGGCTEQAGDAVFGGAAVLTAVVGKLDELDEPIIQDQRMVRATEKWAACMANAGYRYDEADRIDEDSRRFRAIVGAGARPGATTPPDLASSYDRAALADLKGEEVKIANADLACEKREITPVESMVRPQYEQTFRRENRSLIVRIPPVGR